MTGIVAAFVSAPISAIAFGGVTGSAVPTSSSRRSARADRTSYNASLGQGLFSDPIDKTITSFVVYIILASLSPGLIARFPLGERTGRARRE